ncbi:MAG: deoxyribodipyrimidine photo-lyase [Chloroflexi bacterium]|nr:deoxyribodipyrimidine photo-lyase [Chloroflexota bacterium]
MTPPTLWWTRRDLRPHDNFALWAALAQGEPVIPVFVLDPTLLAASDTGEQRVAFLLGCVRSISNTS